MIATHAILYGLDSTTSPIVTSTSNYTFLDKHLENNGLLNAQLSGVDIAGFVIAGISIGVFGCLLFFKLCG